MRTAIISALLLAAIPSAAEKATLVDFQRMALSESPRLKAMESEVRMMKNRISPSGSLDDPKLKLGVNNLPTDDFSFSKEDMTSKEIGIYQMIPLWGKLGTKEWIAAKEHVKTGRKFKKERVEVLHMLRMNVYENTYARSTIAILEEMKKKLKLVINSEIAANRAGMGSLANIVKANIESTMVDEELISLRQKVRETEQKIAYLVGKRVEVPVGALQQPESVIPNAESINRTIATNNPELQMVALDIEISRAELSLKKKEYLPDMEVGLSYMQRDSGPMGRRSDMISGMVTLNIPIWSYNKNAPEVDSMKSKNDAAKQIYLDKKNDLQAKAGILVSQMEKWRDLHALYQKRLIPQAELAMESTLSRYRVSSGEFMPVIDTVRMLLKYKKELNMAIKEYHAARSELHALIGEEVLQ